MGLLFESLFCEPIKIIIVQEFKRKNDYSVSVFGTGGFLCKYIYVGNLYKMSLFLNEKFPSWEYMNVYARRSGRYLMRYYRGQYIPAYPMG